MGGGDRYLFTIALDEAARLDGAAARRSLAATADPERRERVECPWTRAPTRWEETRPPELTERSRELDLPVTLDADVPTASAARHSVSS